MYVYMYKHFLWIIYMISYMDYSQLIPIPKTSKTEVWLNTLLVIFKTLKVPTFICMYL